MLKKYISSPVVMLLLLSIYCIAMAVATFVESNLSTQIARSYVYHNVWFMLLQLLICINGVAIIKKRGLFTLKKIGSLLFHLSFLVILIGAMTTHLLSREGVMHIREGVSSDFIYRSDNSRELLPMEVRLDDFILTRYRGSNSPSSYESHVEINCDGESTKHIIKMNKIVNIDGFRFFQTSYDKDEKGSVLTVNYDFPGMQITYFGYLLLVLGVIITPFQRSSRFRTLNRQFKKLGAILLFLSLFSPSLFANSTSPISVSKEHAERFGALLLQNPKGRIEPVNSWSSKILRKIHHSTEYKEYNADQVFLNLFALPEEWAAQPLIRVKNSEIRELFDSKMEYISYNELFSTDYKYIIQQQVEDAYATSPSERSKFHKDILSLDEVINIMFQIQAGKIMPIFPNPMDTDAAWLSPGDDLSSIMPADSNFISKITSWYGAELRNGAINNQWSEASKIIGMIEIYQRAKGAGGEIDSKRVEAELKYNRLNIFGKSFKLYLILGVILLSLCFYKIFIDASRTLRAAQIMAIVAIWASFIFQTYGFVLRWYISGNGPWSNSYETMIFVAWSIVFIGLAFALKSKLITALCTILAGVLLFVSSLNWLNPEITPLVPVLQSYWLMLHVAIIMMGYGFFFISALIGLFNMVLGSFINSKNRERVENSIKKTTIINEMSMIMGVVFMCIGIFLGAVWANESWGRYWGWDPKETWALITMVIYAAILHMRFVPALNNQWLFNVKSVWAICSVLMTYFGVNYYLSGLHSYSNSEGELLSAPLIIGFVTLSLITLWSLRSYKKLRRSVI